MTDSHAVQRTKRGLDIGTAAELGDLLHELSGDKKVRKIIAKAIREAKPDSPHAAAFADVDLEDKFESFKADQEAKDLKKQQEAVLARMNMQRNRLLTGGDDGEGRKYSEDDMKKLEAFMEKKGCTDYDDGAVLYAATLPPVNPNPGTELPPKHGATWEFPEWAKFGPDPVGASRDAAHQVITEFMRKSR